MFFYVDLGNDVCLQGMWQSDFALLLWQQFSDSTFPTLAMYNPNPYNTCSQKDFIILQFLFTSFSFELTTVGENRPYINMLPCSAIRHETSEINLKTCPPLI